MAGPWEKYQKATPETGETGPWAKYQNGPSQSVDEANSDLSDQFKSFFGEHEATTPQDVLAKNLGVARSAPLSEVEGNVRANMEASKIDKVMQPGTFTDLTSAAQKSGLFNFGDEAYSALVGAPMRMLTDGVGYGEGYKRSQALQAALDTKRENRSPVAEVVGQIAGGMGVGGVAAKSGLSLLNGAKPTLASMMGRGAAEGAGYGAIYGAGDGEGMTERGYNALYGAGTGALAGGATGALARIGAGKAVDEVIPSGDQLKDLGRQAYKAVDDAGVIVKPEGLQRLSGTIKNDLAEFGYHPQLQPRIAPVLQELDRMSQGNATFTGVDTLRKIASSAGSSLDPSEKAIASRIISHIDDYMTGIGPDDILAGNADQAAKSIGQARDYWSRGKKLDLVDQALNSAELRTAATGSGGNIDNATRQRVASLLLDKKKSRGFTGEERAVLEALVRGTPTQNALRLAGKLSPSGNGLMAALGIGGTMVNPMVGLASIGGMGAKSAADAMTRNQAAVAQALIRAGGKSLPKPELSAIRKAVIDAISRSSGQQLQANRAR